MPRPQETERRFQRLLEVLASPIPAGHRFIALAGFLETLPPAAAPAYLTELTEQIPLLRDGSDAYGVDPARLEHAVNTVRSSLPPHQSDEGLGRALADARAALAMLYRTVGEPGHAMRITGSRPDGEEDGHGGSPPARRENASGGVWVPVVEGGPGDDGVTGNDLGILRHLTVEELDWGHGEADLVEANAALVGHGAEWGTLLGPPLAAARAWMAESVQRPHVRPLRLRLAFDRPGALHEGESANLAVGALLVCGLHRLMESRHEVFLTPGSAMTGVIDPDGTVLPVAGRHLAAKVAAVFFSPCRRLVVPAVQLAAAREALAPLRERYPRRHLDLMGAAQLRELFYDRRLTDVRRIALPRRLARRAWKVRRPVAAALILGLAGLLVASWIGPLDREPAAVVYRGEVLVVQNRSGQDLREIAIGRQAVEHVRNLDSLGVKRAMAQLSDVNGDRIRDLLFVLPGEDGTKDPHSLVCLETGGDDPLWSFSARFSFRFPYKTDIATDAFRIEEFWVGDADGDGREDVILLANHVFFPSVVALLDARTGTLRHQYVHVGTLGDMAVVDLDGDGTLEILACGTNNAFAAACLLVLDARALGGHSPTMGAYEVEDVPPARERAYFIIPRTPIGRLFRHLYERNGALAIDVEPAGRRFAVRVQDAGGAVELAGGSFEPDLYYYFDFTLRFRQLATSNQFDTVGRLLWERGELTELPGKEFFEAAGREIRSITGAPVAPDGSSVVTQAGVPTAAEEGTTP